MLIKVLVHATGYMRRHACRMWPAMEGFAGRYTSDVGGRKRTLWLLDLGTDMVVMAKMISLVRDRKGQPGISDAHGARWVHYYPYSTKHNS
jgi:hypothetical protein